MLAPDGSNRGTEGEEAGMAEGVGGNACPRRLPPTVVIGGQGSLGHDENIHDQRE